MTTADEDDGYRALVELSGDAIIVRQDGRFVYVNPAAVRLYGVRDKQDLLGRTMSDFAHPDDLPRIRERAVLLEAGKVAPLEEFRMRRADGSYSAVEILAAPFTFRGRKAVQLIMRDLTERRKADQALRERERELNEAQRLARIGSWEWDVVTGSTTWSREMFRIFGRDPEAGAPPTDQHPGLFTAESWERLSVAALRTLETGVGYELELEAALPDGTTCWTLSRGEGVLDAAGKVIRLRGTVQDIAERRRAEASLRWSERRFQLFMENTPAVAWIKDSQLRIAYISKPYEKQIGLSLASMVGRTDFDVWPAPVATAFRRNDEAVLESGAPLMTYENSLDPQGRESCWLVVKFPLPDATGKPGVAGMGIDVTERHRLEKELLDHQAQASIAMEAAHMAHWSWSASSRRVSHSDGLGLLLGLGRGAQLPTAKDWIRVIHPEDRDGYLAALRGSFRTGDALYRAWRALKPDGSVAWLLTSAKAVRDAAGKPDRMVGVVMDITERRSAQHSLQQYSDRVRQLLHRLVDAQEAERRRLATALHDLIGQNLTALNIGLDILKSDLHAAANSRVGARIGSMAATVEETIDSIRNVMAELHPAELDDYGLVPALHAQAERFRGLTGIGVEIDVPGDLPRLGHAAELALFRIVQEALANVAKHSGARKATVSVSRKGPWIGLAVEDNGLGIAERGDASSPARGGWGLPAMRERAEAVGGDLKIQRPPGGGTRVLVELKVPDAD